MSSTPHIGRKSRLRELFRAILLVTGKNPSNNELGMILFGKKLSSSVDFLEELDGENKDGQVIEYTLTNDEKTATHHTPYPVKFSVVLPTFNRPLLLEKALFALLNQEGMNRDDYEILVIDDHSCEETKLVVEKIMKSAVHAQISYIRLKKNRGPSIARNMGILFARGEFICFTDDDCIVSPNWLFTMQKMLRTNDDIVGVGGWRMPTEEHKSIYAEFVVEQDAHLACAEKKSDSFSEHLAGDTASMCYRKSLLLELGGFNSFIRYPSLVDWEFKKRVSEKHYILLYTPELLVRHAHAKTVTAFCRRYMFRGWGYFLMWHFHPEVTWFYRYTMLRTAHAILGEYIWITERPYTTKKKTLFIMLATVKHAMIWFGKYWGVYVTLSRKYRDAGARHRKCVFFFRKNCGNPMETSSSVVGSVYAPQNALTSGLRKEAKKGYKYHMLTFLRTTKLTIDKKQGALKEDFPMHDYLQTHNASIEAFPFPHIVADNFFKEEIYAKLLKHFQSVLDRGFSEEDDPTRFHPFLNMKGEYEYDGYLYQLRPEEEPALAIFSTVAWNLFFSKIFKRPTGWCTSFAYHHHPVGDQTGFVHHDHAPRTFSEHDRLPNGVIFRENSKDKGVFPEMRAIALLYYLGNNEWKEGDGGETGIYRSKGESPIKLVAPKNNRLLAFEISLNSFHAFQENFTPRSCIVQWFHAPMWQKEK